MNCLPCGKRETHYTINGYGVCQECMHTLKSTQQQPTNPDSRGMTAVGAIAIGLAWTIILGGLM